MRKSFPSNLKEEGRTLLHSPWIELKEKKAFSRLLYPNPVCFLSTFKNDSFNEEEQFSKHTLHASLDNPPGPITSTNESTSSDHPVNVIAERNVMVLTWLTPTNNSGRFMFSLNKRRHTASVLVVPKYSDDGSDTTPIKTGIEFGLSIPVKGMEQLVRDVGHASGRWGSKFPQDYAEGGEKASVQVESNKQPMSKRQRKKHAFARGVPGLRPVPFGHVSQTDSCASGDCDLGSSGSVEKNSASTPNECYSNCCFAIDGTVAHMRCRTYHVSTDSIIDNEHYLIMAEVISAFVHPSYWDSEKLLFRPLKPESEAPPYLTFLGSQRFGYVVADMTM